MKETFSLKAPNFSISCAINEDIPEKLDEKHCHDFYEILYVVRGQGKYIVEGSEYEVKPRPLMLVRPFAYHHISLDKSQTYERYVIHFQRKHVFQAASALLDRLTDESETSGSYYSPMAISDTLSASFERFETAMTLPEDEKNAYIQAVLSEIIILLSASSGERILHCEEELGARVIRYLNGNIEKNISLDKLARRFFVSKYYLCRAFKKHNGISVHGYIVQKRIMYAKQLIESGETASGAAYKVGFGDYSAFYRAYVKIVGKAPTAE